MLTIFKASALALAIGGVIVSGTTTNTPQPISFHGQDIQDQRGSMPDILKASPDGALNCYIEAQRAFEPARRDFVIKRVQVCR